MRLSARRSFLAGMSTVLASAAVIEAPAKAAQFEFRCGTNLQTGHPGVTRAKEMWAAVERESGGRIHTQFFPDSSLGGDTAMLGQLRSGALHFQIESPPIMQGIIPVVAVVSLGFGFSNDVEALRAMDGALGDYVRGEVEAKGLHALRHMWNSGMRQITSGTRPIKTVDDMVGFKIRVAEGKMWLDLFKALGAVPTPLNSNEVYTALQTRLVDGQETPLVTTEAARYYEVQKFLSMTSHMWGSLWMVANGDVWKSLPPDLQDVIDRNNMKYTQLERKDTFAMNAALGAKLVQQGLTSNTPDTASFRSRLGPYYEAQKQEIGATAWSLLQRSVSGKLGA